MRVATVTTLKMRWLYTVAVGAELLGDAAFVVVFLAGEDGDANVVELVARPDPAQSFDVLEQGDANYQHHV
jgi:hypothetical protein